MKKRLIDADELITKIQGTASEVARKAPYDAEWFTRMAQRQSEIVLIIADAPTVDAAPVVHGKWIWDEENECWVCSNCEDSALNNYRWQSVDSNYCPSCGAKMKGGEEE